MEKDIFRFKQFSVKQHPSVFKINTDGCLLGVIVSKHLSKQQTLKQAPQKILDIGTGTGVIALMLAQNFSGHIDAIDTDNTAAEQAAHNFSISKWAERLKAFHIDLTSFSQDQRSAYHYIVSNPPFFSNSLKSPYQLNNQAKHNDILTLETLCLSVCQLLHHNGWFYIILPPEEAVHFIKICKGQKLYLQSIIYAKSVAYKSVFRYVLTFNKVSSSSVEEKTIILQQNNGNYTPEYVVLLKDFFLDF